MDKQATLGFVLIGIILIVWMSLQTPPPRPLPATQDTASAAPNRHVTPQQQIPSVQTEPWQGREADSLGRFFSHLSAGQEKNLIIKTSLYTAEISTRGGLIRKWELTRFTTWNGYPVHLVNYEKGGDCSLLFTTSDGKLINTRNLYFTGRFSPWETVTLKDGESFSVDLVLDLGGAKRIVKRYTFEDGKYSFDVELRFEGTDQVVSNFEYQILWENGLPYAERNSVDESHHAMAYAFSGGERIDVDAATVNEVVKRDIGGAMTFVAARTKYFAVAILPEEGASQGAYIEGIHLPQPNHGAYESYSLAVKMPLKGLSVEQGRATVFLGPLDFEVVKSYNRNLDQIMSLGAAWVIRPITEYIMIPLFQFLRMFIPNYGIVIIVFSIIIKLALHPLTRSSMKSMRKMQALQPMMTEIREKHKDDPQKMNHAIMNLYKEYGVNPASGCLPLVLQMPILFALYAVFSSSIELRHAHFVAWITDLSISDVLFKLPFSIPLLGINEVSGLALAMGVTMFIQQKMTVTDPRQKAMVWMMPVMLTLLFNGFPSGLNLYYFVFNLLSIGQQAWFNKRHKSEPLRKVDPKKRQGGLIGRITKELPKLK